ncbi:MAG: amidohydrolase family protein [Gemmatimonadota bacterium]
MTDAAPTAPTRARLRSLVPSALAAAALLFAAAAGQAQSPAEGGGPASHASDAIVPERQQVTAFVGVDVIPMDRERVLEDHTVVVRDGRIDRVGPADEVEVPDGARVAAEGGYLMPGLAEMHAHIPPEGGREWMERVLFLYLANGVTTARGMLGQPEHLDLQADVAAGEVLGPRIYTSGPSINGNSIPNADSARRAVRHQAEAGYDFLKIHPGLTSAEYEALVEEARKAGMEWAGHVSLDVGLRRALETGYATIDHLDRYVEALVPNPDELSGEEVGFFGFGVVERADPSKLEELARATAEAGVWSVPTQSLIERVLAPESPEEMADAPGVRYMPDEMVESWKEAKAEFDQNPDNTPERRERFIQLRRDVIRALHEAGAPLLLGSDAPQVFQVPGFSLHDELELMVASGLTPYEALVTGTRNVAEFFGDEDEYGTVEAGKAADLVLLAANPLEDVSASSEVRGVMARGTWMSAEEIERRLEEGVE